MDATQFERIARAPSRTQQELESMKTNAIAKGQTELAHIAEQIRRERFPVLTKKGCGATPTTAIFRGRAETFPTGKGAYLWLVEQFRLDRPNIFEEYEALHKTYEAIHQPARPTGRRFARSPETLFPPGSKRLGDPGYYTPLAGGWYADTNLNHQDKFSSLLELGYLAKLEYPTDWMFRVEGGTKELAEQQKAVVSVNKFLKSLLKAE